MLTILNKTHTVELAIKKRQDATVEKQFKTENQWLKVKLMLKLIISKTNTTDSNTREPLIKGF